ncbi:des [Symbiodinium pilosum]|uniref:Des protein n=1 Tax=Symbiodinium pilosum TaxID=2952 RepID=A0A812YCP5_SYMPI|nr:des [Symbiodinium pilosum]
MPGKLQSLTAPWWKWLAHRIIRDPIFFYPLASLYVFFLNKPLQHAPYRTVVPLLVYLFLGSQTFFAYLLASWIGGAIGVALFHLQHHCNTPYRCEDDSARNHVDAALLGSTRIPLPWPISVFSYGIEYHHIHHFDVRVPGYHLERCDAEGEAQNLWARVNTVDGLRVLKSLCHTQFRGSSKVADESGRQPQFVSFWPYSVIGLQDT